MSSLTQRGLTLIEVIIVLALIALIMPPTVMAMYQFLWIAPQNSDALTLDHDLRMAAQWISRDGRQAQTFTPGSKPDYEPFRWEDYPSPPVTSYTVRYYHEGSSLMRELTVNGSSSTISIARNIQSYEDISFQLVGSVVTVTLRVTISPPHILAWDDFESGTWSGGEGWLGNWFHKGQAHITDAGDPYQGTYHLRLRGHPKSPGYVKRAVNLAGQSDLLLRFWAKVDSFEWGDQAQCLVSPNGSTWTIVREWDVSDSNNTYHLVDIDLSPFTMSSEFWIAFEAQMAEREDRFYIDDLVIVRPGLVSKTTTAEVQMRPQAGSK